MIIKCEINQGVAYLLSETGAIYRVKISWDREAQLQLVDNVSQEQVRELYKPSMHKHMQWPET